MVYPNYIHRLLTCFQFTKYWDALWTQLLKVVREQSSTSREVKIRKEPIPQDCLELVLQLLGAGSSVCVRSVEGHWRTQAALRVFTQELLYLQSTELKCQSLSLQLWCYFLLFLYLWQESQDREHHLSTGNPCHCLWDRRGKDNSLLSGPGDQQWN